MNRPWVGACVAAEGVGMTAAAAAARTATGLTDHGVAHATALGLLVVVLGGLVEGTALGWLQARALAELLGAAGRRRWFLATILVAGVGWAAASAPAALGGQTGSGQPPLLLVLVGAAALGAVMGAVLGGAQAWALRGRVRHPWRWIAGSSIGWTVAMPIIFAGATGVGAAWPWWLVVPTGTLTGVLAGVALGLCTAPFLAALDGPAWHHAVVVRILSSRRRRRSTRGRGDGLVGLAVTGRRTGCVYRFPVQAAWWPPGRLVVLPGHPERKTWYRNVASRPTMRVLLAGQWVPAEGSLLRESDAAWASARAAYAQRFPSVRAVGNPLVVLTVSRTTAPVRSPDSTTSSSVLRSGT